MSGSGWAQPRRVAGGTVTMRPRLGSIVMRSPRERGERRTTYGGNAAAAIDVDGDTAGRAAARARAAGQGSGRQA